MAYILDHVTPLPPMSELPVDLDSLDKDVAKTITTAHAGSDILGLSTLLAEEVSWEHLWMIGICN